MIVVSVDNSNCFTEHTISSLSTHSTPHLNVEQNTMAKELQFINTNPASVFPNVQKSDDSSRTENKDCSAKNDGSVSINMSNNKAQHISLKSSNQKNSSMEYLMKLLNRFDEEDILRALEERKENFSKDSNLIKNDKLKTSVNGTLKSHVKEKKLFKNSFIKSKPQVALEKSTGTKNADKRKKILVPQEKKFKGDVSSCKHNKTIMIASRTPSDKPLVQTTKLKPKELKMSPKEQTMLTSHSHCASPNHIITADESMGSLLETPSTSSSSLAPKSATTVLLPESDHSIKCSPNKSKVCFFCFEFECLIYLFKFTFASFTFVFSFQFIVKFIVHFLKFM